MGTELIDRRMAAALLGCSTKTVDRLCRRGDLAWVSVGRAVRFRPQALEEFIAANERNGTGGGSNGASKCDERELAPERVVIGPGERRFVPPALRQRRQRRNGSG